MTPALATPESARRGPSGAPGWSVRAVLVALVIVGLGAPLLSNAFGVYDRVGNWGKLVHGVEGACATAIFGLLFLGWRDVAEIDFTDELSTLMMIFFGIFFGAMWEIVEFVRDWVAYSDLQKSNTDTMTDLLWNNVACVLAALIVIRAYTRVVSPAGRRRLGETAEWLVDGPSRLLDRHGLTLTIIAACGIAAAVASLWFAGRPVPGLSIP